MVLGAHTTSRKNTLGPYKHRPLSAVRPNSENGDSVSIPLFLGANDAENFDPSSVNDFIVYELLQKAIQKQEIEIFVQPIRNFPQRNKIPAFKIYGHIKARPGITIPDSRYIEVARANNMITDHDRLFIIATLKTIESTLAYEKARGRHNTMPDFLIQIQPESFKDEGFIQGLLMFLKHKHDLARYMVFEIPQALYDSGHQDMRDFLETLKSLGCKTALSQVQTLRFDLKALKNTETQYVKIPASLMTPFNTSDTNRTILNTLLSKLDSNGFDVIVEGLHNEQSVKDLLDFDFPMGQGDLFGRPETQSVYNLRRAA